MFQFHNKIGFHPRTNTTLFTVPVDTIIELRHRELRQGLPLETANFDGDNLPNTWHFALVRSGSTKVVSCASFMFQKYKLELAWQLRGMATDSKHRGRGFGTVLLNGAEELLLELSKIKLFWCNARVSAISFYEDNGWKIDGPVFDMKNAGPHRVMVKRI